MRGEKEKAFEWLQISFDTHDTGTLGLLIDPLLRDLRDDPRYKRLARKTGFTRRSMSKETVVRHDHTNSK